MQLHLLEELRSRLKDLGLDKHEAQLLTHARLAFNLLLDGKSTGELGESRWGGAPDVPADFQWPHDHKYPLTFLAQINLADLIADDENPFPATGLLQFFVDFESNVNHVFLIDAATPIQATVAPEDLGSSWGDMPAHRLKLQPRADLPQWATSDYIQLTSDLSDKEQDAYGQLSLTEVYAPTPERQTLAGQLLGHVAGIGYDPREDAVAQYELESGDRFDDENPNHEAAARRWKNLLRFDSALDLCIGDAGYFNFLINENDLKKLDFSRLNCGLQSS
ncbi:DUF1963 domain-containing protein [bacterium]|nr:MAG: DUF1963 domain-containing protein [bacterium]